MSYTKTNWATDDVITEAKLDNLETQYDEAMTQPRCRVRLSSSQSATAGANTHVQFQTVEYDSHTIYDTVNDKFVIPTGKGGIWAFSLGMKWLDTTAEKQLFIQNITTARNLAKISIPSGISLMCSGEAELAAGDELKVLAYYASGSNSLQPDHYAVCSMRRVATSV